MTCVPGLGYSGLMNLQKFTKEGGLFIGVMDTADLAVSTGFTPGVSIAQSATTESHRCSVALESGRCEKPDRLRLWRFVVHLLLQWSDF